MVATVGSISIDLSTNAVKFQDGFKRAATTVDRETKRMSTSMSALGNAGKRMGGLMQGFVGGLAAGAVTAGLGALSGALGKARQALSDFEEIGIRAKASGLGTDFFQGLAFGAGQVDVEMETLNKSLEVFAKNVGLARDGSGALYSGLLKVNPELLKAVLTAGDQEARLKLVAEAMSRMTDETQKAALASIAFGKGGLDMVRVLDGGAAALDHFTATAREMGIIIPPDLIERAGKLDDQMTVLAQVINVNMNQALVNLAPALAKGSEGLARFAKDLNALTGVVNAFVTNPSWATFDKLWDKLFGVHIAEGSFADRVGEMFKSAGRAIEEIVVDLTHAELALDDLRKQGFEETNDAVLSLVETVRQLKEELFKATNAGIIMAGAMNRDLASISRFRQGEAASWNATGNVRRGTEPDIKAEIDPDVMDKIEDAIDKETGATEDVYDRIGELDRNIGGYIGDLGGSVEYSFKNLNDAVDALGHSIVEMAKINVDPNFSFTGLGGSSPNSGSSESWAGRRYTYKTGSVTMPLSSGVAGTPEAPVSETVGETGTINVSVVVKPVMEGTRLSAQSTAEIKQAASAGAEAALRAYHGR